jgi:pyrimidine-nucleoside phosphorylase
MRIYDIILKKRNGSSLTKEEIDFFVEKYTSGEIKDYQASALMMAIFFQGMNDDETAYLTAAMANSGETVDLSQFGQLSADKHSTGGVGDKTSLLVAPIVASLSGVVAKMSGRGLGHTGGTVDKLEAIPGYKSELSGKEFIEVVKKTGVAVIGQSAVLAPCDKKLYALRDVTATVDSIPLITSSIMSKKLAAGARNIVLDVKYGSGAFMKTKEEATVLAENMVNIGKKCSRNMAAVITNMDIPLGKNVGNALEVMEAAELLKKPTECDLLNVVIALSTNLVALVKGITLKDAEKQVREALYSGKAFNKMKEWIAAQGGEIRYIEDTALFKEDTCKKEIISLQDGYVSKMDTEAIGIAASLSGAGRVSKEDVIDSLAGLIIHKKTGDHVKKGESLATVYANSAERISLAEKKYISALEFSENKPEAQPLIYKIIT